MKSSGVVYLDGAFVAGESARISVFDRGLYADGLLETVRAYGGRPFALDRHIERLTASAEFLEIPVPAVEWLPAIGKVLRRNGLERSDAWIRITLTRGPAPRGLAMPRQPRPTLMITAGKVDPTIASLQRRGVRLVTVPFCRDPFLAAHKTLNYLPGILAKAVATRAGAYDGLFTDHKGRVLEATTANLFVWKGDELWTPKEGMLPGVTRALVMKLARDRGVHLRERAISVRELIQANEAFLTSSVVEILPVVGIAEDRVGNAKAGPRTRMLSQAFRAMRRTGAVGSS